MSDMLARLAARAQESPVVLGRRIGYRFGPAADHQEAWPGEEAWLGEQRIMRTGEPAAATQADGGEVPAGPAAPRARASATEAPLPAPRTGGSDAAGATLQAEPAPPANRPRTSTAGLDAAMREGATAMRAMTPATGATPPPPIAPEQMVPLAGPSAGSPSADAGAQAARALPTPLAGARSGPVLAPVVQRKVATAVTPPATGAAEVARVAAPSGAASIANAEPRPRARGSEAGLPAAAIPHAPGNAFEARGADEASAASAGGTGASPPSGEPPASSARRAPAGPRRSIASPLAKPSVAARKAEGMEPAASVDPPSLPGHAPLDAVARTISEPMASAFAHASMPAASGAPAAMAAHLTPSAPTTSPAEDTPPAAPTPAPASPAAPSARQRAALSQHAAPETAPAPPTHSPASEAPGAITPRRPARPANGMPAGAQPREPASVAQRSAKADKGIAAGSRAPAPPTAAPVALASPDELQTFPGNVPKPAIRAVPESAPPPLAAAASPIRGRQARDRETGGRHDAQSTPRGGPSTLEPGEAGIRPPSFETPRRPDRTPAGDLPATPARAPATRSVAAEVMPPPQPGRRPPLPAPPSGDIRIDIGRIAIDLPRPRSAPARPQPPPLKAKPRGGPNA